MKTPWNTPQRERGAAAIETIGVIALVGLVVIIAVQGIFAAQLGSVTEAAARDGARAVETSGANPNSVVTSSLPGWANLRSVKTGAAAKAGCAGTCVRVETDFDIGLAGIKRTITVERVAELPGL